MKISEFTSKINRKEILPDLNLPKYQLLRKEVVPDRDIPSSLVIKDNEVDGSTRFLESSSTSDTKLPDHIAEVIKKEYVDLEKFINGEEEILGFNKDILPYLWKESGYGVGFKSPEGRRPSSGRTWLLADNLINNRINGSWSLIEDQVSFGTLNQEIINKSRPGWIDRVLSVFSKKYHDKIFAEELKQYINEGGQQVNRNSLEEDTKIVNLMVNDFFNRVKFKISESKELKNHLKTIFSQISNAKRMGQTALLEKLAVEMVIEVYEGALIAAGYDKYITLEDLIKMEKNSPRGLSLDLIHNFSRIIPQEVVEKKMLADGLCIFDHYVVLHFDPENKNTAKTTNQVENEIKRDPILFGILLDSNKLYYVADWIDEYCDLTWEKALEILGEKEENHTLKLKSEQK